jgi:putative acetyltransferase
MEGVITIRPESLADHEAVYTINREAFGAEGEARLVEALRRSPAFIPELSLVAFEGSKAVGHILFTPIVVRSAERSHDALALAPMAVLPAYQKQGIGSALVRRGLDDARALGHTVVIVVGHPEYYPRFGFVPARPLGINAPFEVASEAFMALELRPDALQSVHGDVEYPAPFSDV